MVTAGDSPVEALADDSLGRQALAVTVAEEIRTLDASRGFVLALTGPWGSGKTSLLNLVKLSLADEPPLRVVDFNPWMFAGTDQLVDAFFRELAAQLRGGGRLLDSIAADLDKYAAYLAPLALVPYLGKVVTAAKDAAGALRQHGSVVRQRDVLIDGLRQLDRPVVVVVDDIDRLERVDIRDVFKLVRLTGNFPNVVYVLAFDRVRVEQALSESGPDGRAYLEKIVQLVVDIPATPTAQLTRHLIAAVGASVPRTRLDHDRWNDVLTSVVTPLVSTIRDVARYAASVRPTLRSVGEDVDVVDTLALEAVRLFLPDTFRAIVSAQQALTVLQPADANATDRTRRLLESVLDTAPAHEDAVRALVTHLFPGAAAVLDGSLREDATRANRWFRERRVAHPSVLSRYLEHTASEAYAIFLDAERALHLLGDRDGLTDFLAEVPAGRLRYVLYVLPGLVQDVPADTVSTGCATLLDALGLIQPEPEQRWSTEPADPVIEVAAALLRQIPSTEPGWDRVVDIARDVRLPSGRVALVAAVERALLHDVLVSRLRDAIAESISDAPSSAWRQDPQPLWVIRTVREWGGSRAPVLPSDDLELNAAVFREALVPADDFPHRYVDLRWDELVAAYGGGTKPIEHAVETLRWKALVDPDLAAAVEFANRHLDG